MNAQFDTLAFSKVLQDAGIDESVRNAITRAIQDVAMKNVATTQDVESAVHTVTVRVGAMLGVGLSVAVALLAALITLN